jgi:hypothetical protein
MFGSLARILVRYESRLPHIIIDLFHGLAGSELGIDRTQSGPDDSLSLRERARVRGIRHPSEPETRELPSSVTLTSQ